MAYSLLNYTKFLADKALKRQLITFQDFADEFELKTLRSTTAPLNHVSKWSKSIRGDGYGREYFGMGC